VTPATDAIVGRAIERLSPLLEALPGATLVVGKGGVGKTTCAVALARAFARRHERTLLLSTDPAAALATVLEAPVGTDAAPVAGEPDLDVRQLDAARLRDDFLARWRDVIAEIIDRGTYLDRSDVEGLVDAALPGGDEIFALLALADLLADPATPHARIVIDTAPTGHTLRLLALPETFDALIAMLDLMQEKHRFMVRALTHRYRRDQADDFLTELRERIVRLRSTLADGRAAAAVLVTRAEPVVRAESRRYLASLDALGLRVAAVVVNAVASDAPPDALDANRVQVTIPFVAPAHDDAPSTAGHQPAALPVLPTLTIVGGKGGVGKSTAALALAIHAADEGAGDVLVVSTDPAPSLADALGDTNAGWAAHDAEHRPNGVPGLIVRQMDASAAFARVRDTYQDRIDALFDSLVARGIDVQQDRAILRDLLALAPPGIDELFALSLLGDAIAERRFARIIVDPAPTGHLLRLLDMPAIALDWTHRLMRLMLKYREIVGLGDTAQELLDFAKRTRALDQLLHSPQATMVLVTLDEPIVRAETARLVQAMRARRIALSFVLWNRTRRLPRPLPANDAPRQFVAEETSPPPIGIHALRAWPGSWRTLAPSSL